VVAPIEALVLSEYVERGDSAEAQLDLRLTPTEFAALPPFLPDETILRLVNATLTQDAVVQNAYSYSEHRHSDVMAEVEAGRVSLYGRADLASAGEQAIVALEATPGVVEVADYLLYLEDLQAKVEEALAAKGLEGIIVLSEHALIILRGEVPDAKTRYQAEDIAKGVPGVRGVVNDIVVNAQV
jgi:osmotically-inducible protein OsmY